MGKIATVTSDLPDPTTRAFITIGCMVSTIMVAIDGTIAQVALPKIQSAMMATSDQIVWVLTSYFIATAITIPLAGWLAGRIGRKPIMLASVAGFTLASLACGMATNIEQLVAFRLLQGVSGASLVPLSQAVMLDINPPERHGQAMALYGMGAILGPVIGPSLGGWLTDTMGWRWIFFINLPIGIAAVILYSVFLRRRRNRQSAPFDLSGFVLMSIFIASSQLMLDRGQLLDWFESTEILIEATIAVLFGFLALAHMFTVPNPFIKPKIFADRNFLIGITITVAHAMLIFAVLALLAPMMQQLMGYPVMLTGLIAAPRGLGTMAAMFTAGALINRIDARYLMMFGLGLASFTLWLMCQFTLEMDSWPMIWTGFAQGFGGGLVFVPMTTLMLATITPELRDETAALISLTRNMAAAVGIAALQAMTLRNTTTVHSRLVETVRPDNPMLPFRQPGADFDLPGWLALMDRIIAREATMVGYVDSFWFLSVALAGVIPLCLLLDKPKRPGAKKP